MNRCPRCSIDDEAFGPFEEAIGNGWYLFGFECLRCGFRQVDGRFQRWDRRPAPEQKEKPEGFRCPFDYACLKYENCDCPDLENGKCLKMVR